MNSFHLQTVQAAALYALDAIARHRSKLSEVLTAVNASANHGTLLFILRKVTVAMDSEDGKVSYSSGSENHLDHCTYSTSMFIAHYPQDFLDALFAFVTYLIQTQSGGQMLMSAGIIPTLLTILGNKKTTQLKVHRIPFIYSVISTSRHLYINPCFLL
jgi:E3 ubiquitin-protein ligase HUWE1